MGAAEKIVADEVEREPTLRETLEAARDEVVARQEKEDGQAGDSTPGSERQRDATGRFARREGERPEGATPDSVVGEKAAPARGAAPGTANDADGVQQSRAAAPSPVALPAPAGWNAQDKALWAKVPPDVQQVIARRETDVARKISEQDEVRLVGNDFMRVANQYAPVIQARGGNPVALFNELIGIVAQIHNSDPASRAALFRQLAANNGVDLRALSAPGAPQAQPAPNSVPIDQLVARQVDEQFRVRQAREQQDREAAEMHAVNGEIETFRSKTTEQGQLAYPYFDHVNSLMAALLSGGTASTLEEAYNLAVRAHPETSKLIAEADQASAKAKEEARRKAESARRKAGSVRGGIGGASAPPAGDRSIRDELKAAFAEVNGRL